MKQKVLIFPGLFFLTFICINIDSDNEFLTSYPPGGFLIYLMLDTRNIFNQE